MIIDRLKNFSGRLKLVRDKTFVHIDKEGVFNPQAIYREASIGEEELLENVDSLWKVLGRLQLQTFRQNAPREILDCTIEQLQEVFRRDIRFLGDKTGTV